MCNLRITLCSKEHIVMMKNLINEKDDSPIADFKFDSYSRFLQNEPQGIGRYYFICPFIMVNEWAGNE